MNYPIRIFSKAYSPSPDEDNYSIQIDKTIWERVMREEGSKRKFLQINHPVGLDAWIAPIGQPVQIQNIQEEAKEESKEEKKYNIYMPLWMIDAAQFGGEGEETTLDILDEEYFPEATKIVFRVVDSAIYNADIKEELEKALSSIGVVREHTTLQIPVEALGGYKIEVFVSKTEPANLVLGDGEEVAVEFEEPVDQISPPPRVDTPPPSPVSFTSVSNAASEGFQAFQGEGRTIGDSNTNIPEWRRGLLPPPRR